MTYAPLMAKIGLYQEVDIAGFETTRRPPISPMGGCEQGVNGVVGSPMQARGMGFQALAGEGPVGHLRRNAAMLPLEAKKLLVRKAVGGRKEFRNVRLCQQKITLIDVKKAHLHGDLEDHESACLLVYLLRVGSPPWTLRGPCQS